MRLLILIFLPLNAWSQEESLQRLSERLSILRDEVKNVDQGKVNILQKLEFNDEQLYRLVLVRETVDQKGRSELEEWRFNLADIDPRLVRWESSRSSITVHLKVKGGDDLIQFFENGEVKGYEDEVEILAVDIDNARAMVENLKTAQPPAAELYEKRHLSDALSDYRSMLGWLEENVRDAGLGKEIRRQVLRADDAHTDYVHLSVEEVDEKGGGTQWRYYFSLADLNVAAIEYTAKGEDLFIEIDTRQKQRVIDVLEDGEPQNFSNSIQFFFDDVDVARQAIRVLRAVIPEAEKVRSERRRKPATVEEALQSLRGALGVIRQGDTEIAQSLSGDCLAELTVVTSDAKGRREERFSFHFGDLVDQVPELDISGREIVLPLETKPLMGERKLIGYEKDGEPQNFRDNLGFYAADVEQAGILQMLAPEVARGCRQAEPPRDVAWLMDNINVTPVGDVRQTLSRPDENTPCKLSYRKVDEGGKKVSEEIFDFNLHDLDERKIQLEISGREVAIELNANYKEKIISYYKDGEPEFTNVLELSVANPEIAKIFLATLEQVITECKER